MKWRNGAGGVLAMACLAVWGAEPSPGLMQCPKGWEIQIQDGDRDLRALWRAAEEGDEAAFSAGIGAIPDVDRYSYRGQPLLRALLTPPPSFRKQNIEDARLFPQRSEQLKKRYAERVASKERMLALALQRKLRWQRCDDHDADVGPPLLFLASYLGSPELLRLALGAGISPDQNLGRLESGSALEALLEPDRSYLTQTGLPELPYRPVFGRYIAMLLDAGAKEPYANERQADDQALNLGEERLIRIWEPAFRLSAGNEGAMALWRHGIQPSAYAADGKLESPVALALVYGDIGSARFLRERMPRTAQDRRSGVRYDLWLQAAAQSLYSTSEPLEHWWAADMGWQDRIAVYLPRKPSLYADRTGGPRFSASHTLLEHAILAGRGDALEWLLSSAPRPLSPSLLSLAIQQKQPDMAKRLLEQGIAFDATGQRGADWAFREAVKMHSLPLMDAVLSREPALAAMMSDAGEMYGLSAGQAVSGGAAGADIVQRLMQAGFPPERAGEGLLLDLARKGDWASLVLLAKRAPLGVDGGRLLAISAGGGQTELVQMLLARGISPHADSQGQYSPLTAALQAGHAETAAVLEKAGATVAPSARLRALSGSHDFAALRSAAAAVPGGLSGFCPDSRALALSLRDSRWLRALLAAGLPKRYRCQGTTKELFDDLAARLLENDFAPLFDTAAMREAGAALRMAAIGKRTSISRELQQSVIGRDRGDLRQLLEMLGVVFDVRPAASAQPLSPAARKLAGTYQLQGDDSKRLVLEKNGRFRWSERLEKGAVLAYGGWAVGAGGLMLEPDPLPPTPPYYAAKVDDGNVPDSIVFVRDGRFELGLRGEVAIAEGDGSMAIIPYETGSKSAPIQVKAGIRALAYREDSVSAWQGIWLAPNLRGQRQGWWHGRGRVRRNGIGSGPLGMTRILKSPRRRMGWRWTTAPACI
ncbi:Ankyrin repeats (3 copies) [Chromobacterium vaccinii]|nr:Ankyrin repeats (3 copies) [Chromobacterium vaccinii]